MLQRQLVESDPFKHPVPVESPWSRSQWPAKWIRHPQQPAGVDGVALYRLRFTWPGGPLRIHASADQRFRLHLDGVDLGGGPERGDLAHWRFHTWAGDLAAGEHVLVARVWWLIDAPHAQCSLRPAFLLGAEGEAAVWLDTGIAPWQVRLERCWQPLPKRMCWGTGSRVRLTLDADHAAAVCGGGDGWCTPLETGPANAAGGGQSNRGGVWRLVPARLPAQSEQVQQLGQVLLVADAAGLDEKGLERCALDVAHHLTAEAAAWQKLLAGIGAVVLPAGARRRVLIDLGEYRCLYPEVTLSGQGQLGVAVAEACFLARDGELKGQRDAWQGGFFRSAINEFVIDAEDARSGSTLWWESGRFVEVVVEAGNRPLRLQRIAWRTTGYPLHEDARFASSDAALQAAFPIMMRTLTACMHETFMDCPYYEQLQYAGDTRIECQVVRALTRDHRLCRQAVDAFAHSLRDDGRLSSRWPTWEWQDIPTFGLAWIGMLHDALYYGTDADLVRSHLVTMRTVLERARACVRADGLLGWMEGWNFVDWVPGWPGGETPGEAGTGGGATNTWLLVCAARWAADIETWAGEPDLAERDRAFAQRLAEACDRHLWDEQAGCYADTPARATWSEHAQLMALLAQPAPSRGERLLAALDHADRTRGKPVAGHGYAMDPNLLARVQAAYADPGHLAQPTVYFSHYRFEVAARWRRPQLFFARLGYWRDLAGQGFTTVPEMPEPSRSDCHAWGTHPRFHAAATILGIRPAAPLFASARIAPALGPLEWAEGTWPHPAGDIHVRVWREGTQVRGDATVPPGITGILACDGQPERIFAGRITW